MHKSQVLPVNSDNTFAGKIAAFFRNLFDFSNKQARKSLNAEFVARCRLVVQARSSALYHQLDGFFQGTSTDAAGRSFSYILQQDDEWWEQKHDFIQWVFPSVTPSACSIAAPVVTPAELVVLGADNSAALEAAFYRYLRFLGITYDHKGRLVDMPAGVANDVWREGPDHNDLRITRVIYCLRGAMLEDKAQDLFDYLSVKFLHHPGKKESLKYWKQAATAAVLPVF